MDVVVWLDLILFIVLLALFVYIFASVTITSLHKIYLVFHFFMMLWPFCQFVIKTTDNPGFQLFYVKVAFVDSVLIAIGWLLFTIFLTGKSHYLQRKIYFALLVPTLLVAFAVFINPDGMFVEPVNGGYIQRTYGPIFWIIIAILTTHVIVSLYIIYLALVSNSTPRIKKQVAHVLKGVTVLTGFVLLDIFLNVILTQFIPLPIIPGMTSLGILLSAVYFVIAIHRDKVFDLVTIAHQDIINTISHGILVLNDDETVVEINQSLLPKINLNVGDHFDIMSIIPEDQSSSPFQLFLHTYQNKPMERAETEYYYPALNTYLNIQAAPIIVSEVMVGRIITFQDMTELYQTNQKLKQMAITDSLTGCYNRHYLTQQLEQEVIDNMRANKPFAIILLDIDFFKTVNDNYGHLVGDVVLCETVEVIKQTLRETDILARYGGEEFIVYLPNTDPVQANQFAEHVKSLIEANNIKVDNVHHPLSITVSMGLLSINNFAILHPDSPTNYLNDLFETVDKALYQAKNTGRNQIVEIIR